MKKEYNAWVICCNSEFLRDLNFFKLNVITHVKFDCRHFSSSAHIWSYNVYYIQRCLINMEAGALNGLTRWLKLPNNSSKSIKFWWNKLETAGSIKCVKNVHINWGIQICRFSFFPPRTVSPQGEKKFMTYDRWEVWVLPCIIRRKVVPSPSTGLSRLTAGDWELLPGFSGACNLKMPNSAL